MIKRASLLILIIATASVATWAILRFVNAKRTSVPQLANVEPNSPAYTWEQAVALVKADRSDVERSEAIQTPPELRHYPERHWFLAAQVAEVEKYGLRNSQDFLDLASMIEGGDFVSVPAVTDSYVLYGVGKTADDNSFSRYEDGQNIELYSETQLSEAYKLLDEKRTKLQNEIAELRGRSTRLKKGERTQQQNLQKQITGLELDLKSTDEERLRFDELYGDKARRQTLTRDYDSLQRLAQNFGGRTYNLNEPSNRLAMKIHMLSSLRPVALRVMEEIASGYHSKFNRPLPVSSLVRPEQYQRALRRVNRNAVLIETPPHSTGLAFDIDYRYMSAAEQNFLMRELARIKNEGRIEVIRESNANYHVFAFIQGTRPSDELITAAVAKLSEPVPLAHHSEQKTSKAQSKSPKARSKAKPQKRKRR